MASASTPGAVQPLPLAALPARALDSILGLFTDIDDTLTAEGVIEPAALRALEQLAAAGVPVVAITGRPAGWSRPFAASWPVAAIVAENGAVALTRGADGRVQSEYAQDDATRRRNRARLDEVAAQVLRAVPGARLARDSAGRETDIAIDHAEFSALDPASIAEVVSLMRAAGMVATVSSIHINGWFGEHDKWSGAAWMVRRLYGRPLQEEIERWIYVGDSTNDQVMFGRFPISVGVANLMDFADQLQTWPRYLCDEPRGRGFAELARRVLQARAGVPRPG
jgi:HAD superfamily hydrolase (TIGR01484 family)